MSNSFMMTYYSRLEEKWEHIASLDDYAAPFIPGGWWPLLKSKDLGRLLHIAHERGLPTVTLYHGPATLLSVAIENDFA